MTTTTTTTDFATLAAGIEARDADAAVAHYAPDAVLTLVDPDHQPSAPSVLTGLDAIDAYYRDICARNLDHQVSDLVSTPDRLAYVERCRYPTGERVICATVATVADGRITSQTAVSVWDD